MDKINSTTVREIPASKFIPLRIKTKEGELIEMNKEQVKAFIIKKVFGGVSYEHLEEELKKAGVKGDDYEKRKKIIRILKDLGEDENEISEEDREELTTSIEEHENN